MASAVCDQSMQARQHFCCWHGNAKSGARVTADMAKTRLEWPMTYGAHSGDWPRPNHSNWFGRGQSPKFKRRTLQAVLYAFTISSGHLLSIDELQYNMSYKDGFWANTGHLCIAIVPKVLSHVSKNAGVSKF